MRVLISLTIVGGLTWWAPAAAQPTVATAPGGQVLQTVDGDTIGQVTIAPLPDGWRALGKNVYESNIQVLGAVTGNGRPATALNVKLGGPAANVAPPSSAAVVANADRARTEFGWVPQYDDLEFIVETALKWESDLAKRNRF